MHCAYRDLGLGFQDGKEESASVLHVSQVKRQLCQGLRGKGRLSARVDLKMYQVEKSREAQHQGFFVSLGKEHQVFPRLGKQIRLVKQGPRKRSLGGIALGLQELQFRVQKDRQGNTILGLDFLGQGLGKIGLLTQEVRQVVGGLIRVWRVYPQVGQG